MSDIADILFAAIGTAFLFNLAVRVWRRLFKKTICPRAESAACWLLCDFNEPKGYCSKFKKNVSDVSPWRR